MRSTTYISKFTPAVLEAVCEQKRMTKKELRLQTLRDVRHVIGVFLEKPTLPLDDVDRGALEHLHRAVRLAIGEE